MATMPFTPCSSDPCTDVTVSILQTVFGPVIRNLTLGADPSGIDPAVNVIAMMMAYFNSGVMAVAALMMIGAEFLPLYVQLMLHLAFLTVCSLLCGLASNSRCQALFACMAEAVKCMAAITALYFELLTVGVGLLMMTGGG